jgi:chitodextrinase
VEVASGVSPSIHIIHYYPQWINVTGTVPGAAPPGAEGGTMVADPLDNDTVYFGGCTASQCPDAQTWVFAHGVWTNITNPSDAPPARSGASMDYDANMRAVLLFGGSGTGGALGDTWVFQGGVWTNLTFVSAGPTPRAGAALAFDPAPEENGSVLYGGCVFSHLNDICSDDTWVWQGWSGWVPLSSSLVPDSVGFAAMAYDPSSGFVVLFGGCSGFLCEDRDGSTWELYSGEWWAVYPTSSPEARSDMSMVYDPTIPGLLLFGGGTGAFPSFTELDDTWSFANGAWTQYSPSTPPSARDDYALGTDPTGNTPLLFGGSSSTGSEGDTWAYEYGPAVSLGASTLHPEVSQPVALTVSVADGTAPYNATIRFANGSAALVYGTGTTFHVTHTFSAAGTYVAYTNLTDGVGAVASAIPQTFTVVSGPQVRASVSPSGGDVGLPTTFRANASGGVAPFHYEWQFGDGTNSTSADATHVYAMAGRAIATVTATDSDGGVATATVWVPVAPDPSLTIAAGPAAPGVSADRLSANVTGGTAPFNYSWSFGDGSTSGLPSPVHQFAGSGTYTVVLWVNDSAGGSVHRSMAVSASGPSVSGTSSSGGSAAPLWFWIGLAALLVVGAMGAVWLYRRPRPPGPAGPP